MKRHQIEEEASTDSESIVSLLSKNTDYNTCSRVKYLHFLLHFSQGWARIILQIFNTPENGFNLSDHFFITSREKIYNDAQGIYDNIFFEKSCGIGGVDLINKYGKFGDTIIVHSFRGPKTALKVEKSLRSKIVWRTWGHDVKLHYRDGIFKDIKNFYLNQKWKRVVRDFRGVGHGGAVDEIDIEDFFGKKVKKFFMPYVEIGNYESLCKARDLENKKENLVKVCVGHSGFAKDNHVELIKRLKVYENENIKLFFVLTYGNEKYIESLINLIPDLWEGQYEVVRDHMPFDEYAFFMKKMDIIILDGQDSYAIGNLDMALFLGKKLFLNKKGILAKTLKKENIPFASTDKIGAVSFDEFAKPFDYRLNEEHRLCHKPYEDYIRYWKECLEHI